MSENKRVTFHIVTKDSNIQILTESIDKSKVKSISDVKKELELLGLQDFIIVENQDSEFEVLRVLRG